MMRSIPFALFFAIPVLGLAQMAENENHLQGIRYVHMNVDTSEASGIKPSDQLDLSDIVELQLRRAEIDLRPFVVNEPEGNVPLVLVKIDTNSRASAGEFELVLEVHDFVTIDRNDETTVATIFEMKRRAAGSTGSAQIEAIKSELRDMMTEFTTIFRRQNS